MRSDPVKAPVHPWTFPTQPWSRIHVDFTGPVSGALYLVVVDAYCKFPEIVKMTSTMATATINALRDIFSCYGLFEIMVSDNGPQFIASEFQQFCRNNGIMHRTSAAYKPSTNGQAERVVQILKSATVQARLAKQDVNVLIARNLLIDRKTPHATTGKAPSVLLMGRKLRTRLDLILPSLQEHLKQKQCKVLERNDSRNVRSFTVGEKVLARYCQGKDKWVQGVIIEVLGSRHYMVQEFGSVRKQHIDQSLKTDLQLEHEDESDEPEISTEKSSTTSVTEKSPETSHESEDTSDTGLASDSNLPGTNDMGETSFQNPTTCDAESLERRYPLRANRGKNTCSKQNS